MENDEIGSYTFKLGQCPYCGNKPYYNISSGAYLDWLEYHSSYLHRLGQWFKRKRKNRG
jgi:hypothetical protein